MKRVPRKQKKSLKKTQPLIFACYVNVNNMEQKDIKPYLSKVSETINPKTKEYILYIIAVKDQETRIECINPVRMNSKIVNQQIEQNKQRLEECLKENKLVFKA